MSHFEGTARYYRTFRPGIPAEAVSLLTQTVSGVASPVLLDLGSGTGQVPLALHETFAEFDVVEADGGMISEAEAALAAAVPGKTVRLHHVRAEDFTPPSDQWTADLVTICRAFHWMDQGKVLAMLDGCTAPTGTVAVMGDGSLWTARTAWTDALRALIQTYLGSERRAGQSTYNAHDRPYAEILSESAFRHVEEHRYEVRRQWSPQNVLGYLGSTSFASRPLFGDSWEEFEGRALALLGAHAEDGQLIENAVFTILLGRR
ncbi:class I SAM-dependent methyltransferase [Streptomyces syringium]|uniref:class I SAM-dependent methyltransferase n=1 Tax=Streptomyces syringium TaxID=76729 RepID=UPI0033C5008F